MEFAKELSRPSSSRFINIYDVDSEKTLTPTPPRFSTSGMKTSRKKSTIQKEFSYVEVDDGSDAGIVEISGPIQVILIIGSTSLAF